MREHGPRLLAVATRYLPKVQDAEDAVQDAFLNVVRFISAFKRESRLDTWLHRIVVNCALMRLRQKRRKPETVLERSALEGGVPSPWCRSPPPSAHRVLATEEARIIVRASISRLPETQREVLLLRDVDALTMGQIAEVLDIGASTVKVTLHRARRRLQGALDPRLLEIHD